MWLQSVKLSLFSHSVNRVRELPIFLAQPKVFVSSNIRTQKEIFFWPFCSRWNNVGQSVPVQMNEHRVQNTFSPYMWHMALHDTYHYIYRYTSIVAWV